MQIPQLYRRDLPAEFADEVGNHSLLASPDQSGKPGRNLLELLSVVVRYVVGAFVTKQEFLQSAGLHPTNR